MHRPSCVIEVRKVILYAVYFKFIPGKFLKRIYQRRTSLQLCRYGDFIKLNLNITKAFYTDHRNGVRFSNPIIVIALVIVSVVPTGFQFENSVEQSMDDFNNDSTTRM